MIEKNTDIKSSNLDNEKKSNFRKFSINDDEDLEINENINSSIRFMDKADEKMNKTTKSKDF